MLECIVVWWGESLLASLRKKELSGFEIGGSPENCRPVGCGWCFGIVGHEILLGWLAEIWNS